LLSVRVAAVLVGFDGYGDPVDYQTPKDCYGLKSFIRV
jgi:hypothetical protein